jgi:hypothetical protein
VWSTPYRQPPHQGWLQTPPLSIIFYASIAGRLTPAPLELISEAVTENDQCQMDGLLMNISGNSQMAHTAQIEPVTSANVRYPKSPFQEDHLPLSGDFIGTKSDSPSCESRNTRSLAGSVLLASLDTTCGFLGDSYQL